MRVLFLDDDDYRKILFGKEIDDASYASTASECIRSICGSEWDYVFLDHDLDLKDLKMNGMDVVRWITEHNPVIGKIIIHSVNHLASQNMYYAIKQAGYKVEIVPFNHLLHQLGKVLTVR